MRISVLERMCSLKKGTYNLNCKLLEALHSGICVAYMFYDFTNAFMPIICTVLKSDLIWVYMGMQANFFNSYTPSSESFGFY
jgi:hypothetical protein